MVRFLKLTRRENDRMWLRNITLSIIVLLTFFLSHKIKKKENKLTYDIFALLFDMMTVSSIALLFFSIIDVNNEQILITFLLLFVIFFFSILIKANNQIIPRHKYIIVSLITIPIVGLIYLGQDYRQSVLATEKKEVSTKNYNHLAKKRDMTIKKQLDNNIQLSNVSTDNELLVISDNFISYGNADKEAFIYGENFDNREDNFLIQANENGEFFIRKDEFDSNDLTRFILYEKDISIYSDGSFELMSQDYKSYSVKQILETPHQILKIGEDIEPGNYVVLTDTYGELEWVNYGTTKLFEKNLYINLKSGESLKISNAILFRHNDNKSYNNNLNRNGMLKVGVDIKEGEYEIVRNSESSLLKYSETIEGDNETGELIFTDEISVRTGEYLYLNDVYLFEK